MIELAGCLCVAWFLATLALIPTLFILFIARALRYQRQRERLLARALRRRNRGPIGRSSLGLDTDS